MPLLTGPDPLVVLYLPQDSTQDDLLCDLPQQHSQADSPGPIADEFKETFFCVF